MYWHGGVEGLPSPIAVRFSHHRCYRLAADLARPCSQCVKTAVTRVWTSRIVTDQLLAGVSGSQSLFHGQGRSVKRRKAARARGEQSMGSVQEIDPARRLVEQGCLQLLLASGYQRDQ